MTVDAIVYVVDDDPSIRKSLTRLLRAAQLPVATFPSAQAFLDYAPPDCPSCLVLDVKMPGLNGLDLQEELRRLGREVLIIFLTGHADVPMTARAMKAGAVDFLEKPFQDEDLLEAIRLALLRDRQERVERALRASIQQRVETLTPRQYEVLKLVVAGLLNKQIARCLGTTEKTIKVHRGQVMHKMQAGSVAELTLLAARIGISAPAPIPSPTAEQNRM